MLHPLTRGMQKTATKHKRRQFARSPLLVREDAPYTIRPRALAGREGALSSAGNVQRRHRRHRRRQQQIPYEQRWEVQLRARRGVAATWVT